MFVLFSIFSLITNVFCQEWDYDYQNEWNSLFKACAGKHESPINIELKDVRIKSFGFNVWNYDQFYRNSYIENNGHTVRVALNTTVDRAPYITGSAVRSERFILDSFHFHWGKTDSEGSEHSINRIKYSAELHFVHYNEIYNNLLSARDTDDGLTVLTVFLKLSPFDNNALNPILNAIPRIINHNTNTTMKDLLNINDLLPTDGNTFFRYNGSLTTPPCSETATFIIFANPIPISSRQLSKFREIFAEPEDGHEILLTHNDRYQQPINDRIVEATAIPVIYEPVINQIANIIQSFFQFF